MKRIHDRRIKKKRSCGWFFSIRDPLRRNQWSDSGTLLDGHSSHSWLPEMGNGCTACIQRSRIEDYHVNISPEKKAQKVQKYRSRISNRNDRRWVNDAVALKTANQLCHRNGRLAIEMHRWLLSMEAPEKIVEIVKLARKTFPNIRQNLFWAFFTNLIAIPLAMRAFASGYQQKSPMFSHSILSSFNSMRLKQDRCYRNS